MGHKGSKTVSTELTSKQLALLLANTNFSEEEIRQWHAGFIRDCPNGRLDRKKFVETYQKFYPQGKADAYCKYAFEAFDKNDDGTIDFDEFLLAVAASGHGDLGDRLSMAFDVYDISDDGQIDRSELTKLITAMYDLTGQTNRDGDASPKARAAHIISQLDEGGDRKLTREEFITGCRNDPYLRQLLTPNA